MTAPPAPLLLTQGRGSRVQDGDGRPLLDLELGFGSAFLGHRHPAVTAALRAQAGRLMSCGRHATEHSATVDALLRALLPPTLRPAGLYSTGMEAAEFALRIAAVHTGRREFAAFARSMHGKSGLTAALGWDNAPLQPGGLHRLPFVDSADEDTMFRTLERTLAPGRVAALLIEPIQGSNQGHEATPAFYRRALDLCRATGTLLVFDETLTGLYRTGPAFYAERLHAAPDLLLFAKCLGNGFPLASVALRSDIAVVREMLPGSTFSGNAMALAATAATLTAMQAQPMQAQVEAIGHTIAALAAPLARAGARLRGRGALWCLAFDEPARAARVHAAALADGLLLSRTDSALRLLPAANLAPRALQRACRVLRRCCEAA